MRACLGHAFLPEARLADPRLAFEHERARTAAQPTEEPDERREFLLSADEPVDVAQCCSRRGATTRRAGAGGYLGGMRTIESQKSSTERTIVMNSSRPTGLTM